MVPIETANGIVELPEQLVQAVVRQAGMQAELTAESLRAMGFLPNRGSCFPAAFLLELGAVTTLNLWELGGQRNQLPDSLSSFEDAKLELIERCQRGREAFADIADTPVSKLVFRISIDHFAWEGMEKSAATFVVGSVPEDEFVNCLAEFLWKHRHELQSVLGGIEK